MCSSQPGLDPTCATRSSLIVAAMNSEWLSIAEASREFAASETTVRRLQKHLGAKQDVRGRRTITVVSRSDCERLFGVGTV